MNRIECLIQIEKELNALGCEFLTFNTRDKVIEINFLDKEFIKQTFYVPYRFLTLKQLHENIRRWVLEQ